MKRFVSVVLWALLVAAGCEEGEILPPTIMVDVSPVNVGVRWVAEDVNPIHFDLQLYNTGDETLILESVDYRGDTNCAFTFEGPDTLELIGQESAFIRGWYNPTVVDNDRIAMEVLSNADNYPEMVVPICGRGVPEGTTFARPAFCDIPPEDQPDCPG